MKTKPVVGFGVVAVSDGPFPGTFTVARVDSLVVSRNASPAFPRAWSEPLEAALGGALDDADVDLLLAESDAVEQPALAAGLVRAYGR